MSKLCWSVLAWSWCIAGLAQNSNPFAADVKAAAEGAGIFQKHCGSCHGKGGHGGRAPDLTRGALASGDQDSDLFLTISKGIDGTEMEAYGDRLGVDNVWRIIAFVRSAGGKDVPLAGDAANGKAIFWGKGGCGSCHAVGDRGNRIGPDLTRISRRRGIDYARESLLDPSADIIPGYGSVTVVLRDGKSIRGIEKALDDFSAVIQDFSGKVYSFDRARARSVTRDEESMMPAYKVLSEGDLNDILAYLWTAGKSEAKP